MNPTEMTAAVETGRLHPIFRDTARLQIERQRLVGYCARLIGGDIQSADEIAQEALATAWQDRERLRDATAWQGWLTGIARNLCLRWCQKRAVEKKRTVEWGGTETGWGEVADLYTPDPYAELERHDVAELLDRALSLLPRPTHALLIDRYILDLPIAEIAARRGLREDTALVQLHRGRAALRRALTAPALREDARILGVLSDQAAEEASWQETSLWCPHCGKRRMLGQFESGDKGKHFILRCPACSPIGEISSAFLYFLYRPGSVARWPLEGISRYRTAAKRLGVWWNDFAETAVTKGSVACAACGANVPTLTRLPESFDVGELEGTRGIYARCPKCHMTCLMNVGERAFNRPEVQKFWGEYPRSILLPVREDTMTGIGAVFITRLESVTNHAALEVVCASESLRVLDIRKAA